MLLKMKQLMLMEEAIGDEKFKARTDLTEDEIKEVLELDDWYFEIEHEHLITNHEELQKKIRT